ncbi:MAG: pilus assembly protein PilM [Hydrogenothermaceae bacterium]|nr:pilus assembly protein PilM [Hydrogenothermaceae bacterium]
MFKLRDLDLSSKLKFILRKQKKYVGIEVDKDFCRVAILQKEIDSISFPILPFEFEIVKDEDQSGRILREEIESKGLTIKHANFSVPISETLFKNLKIPKAQDKELREAIEWNLREELGNPEVSTVYDYAVLAEEDGFFYLVIVITKSDMINRIFSIGEAAGIQPIVIDSVGISLINLALLQRDKVESHSKENNICIIHLDKNECYMLFSKDAITLQPLDFNIERYEQMSPDDKEREVIRLIEEINYFFLAINEPRIIYTSGFFVKYPEIKAYMQLRFGSRFFLEDLDPAIALGMDYRSSFPLQIFATPISLAYRGIEE